MPPSRDVFIRWVAEIQENAVACYSVDEAIEKVETSLAGLIEAARANSGVMRSRSPGDENVIPRDNLFHLHDKPGCWDSDNGPRISNKPCWGCQQLEFLRRAVEELATLKRQSTT